MIEWCHKSLNAKRGMIFWARALRTTGKTCDICINQINSRFKYSRRLSVRVYHLFPLSCTFFHKISFYQQKLWMPVVEWKIKGFKWSVCKDSSRLESKGMDIMPCNLLEFLIREAIPAPPQTPLPWKVAWATFRLFSRKKMNKRQSAKCGFSSHLFHTNSATTAWRQDAPLPLLSYKLVQSLQNDPHLLSCFGCRKVSCTDNYGVDTVRFLCTQVVHFVLSFHSLKIIED